MGLKTHYLDIFWARILENYYHNLNQDLQSCQITKSGEETKILKFGLKNALFGYFDKNLRILNSFIKSFMKFLLILL